MGGERAVLTTPALATSMARISERQDKYAFRFGAPAPTDSADWLACADLLADPARFDLWHDSLSAWLLREHAVSPERTVGGFVKSWYLQVPAFLGALLFHHERRVPSLRPQDIAFRLNAGGRPHPDGIALLRAPFVCLPDDPAAGTPEATVVADEQALADVLRARFTGHAARFIATYRPPVHFGPHSMWGAATDALDTALWKAGVLGGDEARGVSDAVIVLPERIAPFTSSSTVHATHDADGALNWTRRKESCCFSYLLPTKKGACATCPRRSAPLTTDHAS